MLPSLYVAASMPDYVETQILDEDVEPVDFNTDADIIGVSFMTFNAPRAYEIGDIFREKGKTVIFGGFHPTFMPYEALKHADAVCIGEAEPNMVKIIEDFAVGNLQKIYKSNLIDLANLPIPDRSLLKNGPYITLNAMQATRGCHNMCEFCSVSAFNRYVHRKRPVDQVVKEIKQLGKFVLFMDDNITLDREYAKELFTAMIPLKKTWFSQCSITIADDDELLDLAVKSGCRGLFLGFESLSQKNLSGWNKNFNMEKNYYEVARKVHSRGIVIFGAFVFGSDDDGTDVFENTLEFLLKANIETIQATILTPFPGTPMFEKFDSQRRIFDKDWSHYDFFHVVHNPMKMDAETLKNGTSWVQKEFYSRKNIRRRLIRSAGYLSTSMMMRVAIPLNYGYRTKLSGYGIFEIGKKFNPNNNNNNLNGF